MVFSICQQCKENDFHVIPRCENSFQEILIGFYNRLYVQRNSFSQSPIFGRNSILDSEMKKWKKGKFYARKKDCLN